MILLCCKEVNASKQKNKMMGRPMVDKKGRPKLQLKGRIFMQNVTDTVCSSKQGLSCNFEILDVQDAKFCNRIIYMSNILERRSGH
jgi:Pleckstrin homology domain